MTVVPRVRSLPKQVGALGVASALAQLCPAPAYAEQLQLNHAAHNAPPLASPAEPDSAADRPDESERSRHRAILQ